MNKAIYGILAAAALATLKKKSGVGGSNIEGNSLQAQIKSLFRKWRIDAALATVYSFIDFSKTEDNKELSLISNVNIPLSYTLQDVTSLVLSSPSNIEDFSQAISEQIVSSFGSEDKAMKAWQQNAGILIKSYCEYFEKEDYGVAYFLIMNSIYPKDLNEENWYRLFRSCKGSEGDKNSLSLLLVKNKLTNDQEMKSKANKMFISAWLKSKIQPEGQPLLKDDLDFNTIFRSAGNIFYYLATTEPVKNFPIKEYNPGTLYTILSNKLGSNNEFLKSGADNFFMLDLVIKGLFWIKNKLSLIEDEGGYMKYPIDTIDTYAKMWNFWNDPTRVGSETMIFIEMEHYRNNKLIREVPEDYKKEGGFLEVKWSSPDESEGRGTPAWALSSWILFYIYNLIKESKTPSTMEWNQGFRVSSNIFPSINADITKSVLSKVGSIEQLVKSIQNAEDTSSADFIVKTIQQGEEDKTKFGQEIEPFGDPSKDFITDYATLIFSDKQNDLVIYESKSDQRQQMLNFVAQYLGHCNTVSDTSKVYSVFYKGVPFYTIEVNSNNKISQIKGIGNRVMGSMKPANKTGKTSETDLYSSDLNNLSIILPVFSTIGASLRKGMFNKGSDLMLYNSSTVSNHKKPEGIASTIESITR